MNRILIVEDYHTVANVESLLCTMEGYDVRVARTGDEALELGRSFQPDLVLLDLGLPGGIEGTALLRQLRSQAARPLKVLVVSGRLDDGLVAELSAEGDGVETLAKPFKLNELAGRIQTMLEATSQI